MAKLSGRIALVTGGSRGIGAAIVKRLCADGAKVIVNYARNDEAAEQLKAECAKTGGEVMLKRGDLSDPKAITAMFAGIGKLDILVNNAGIAGFKQLKEVDAAFFDQMFALNVRAVLLGIAEASRVMKEGGRIISISSVAAKLSRPGGMTYGASKAAVEAITRNAATELGPRGITVNAVAPGMVETDMLSGLFKDHPDEVQKAVDTTPLRRIGQPGDIADVVAFLASDDARWITGQTLTASGGR